jgi:hypothetical protein
VEAVQIVQHCHIEGRGNGALFLVAAHVDVVVVGVGRLKMPFKGHF